MQQEQQQQAVALVEKEQRALELSQVETLSSTVQQLEAAQQLQVAHSRRVIVGWWWV